ncbi:HK97 gp10 family phage protein [Dietzia sp. 179-F 9C3 NHS]|uniref:HK97 gp10 family phage protein n=1 Tax=Dietzia sp. 179-F 9C3 NHS TaxID=3374295 RepID=UPI003879C797
MAQAVKVDGGARLRRTLRQAGADLQALTDAHAAAAKLVADRARATAPRVSGTLAGTIRPSGTKTRAVVRAGYKSVPYGGPIHWGWPARNITAQPFLTDAAQATEPAWSAIYLTAVDRTLDQVAGA